ncbi:MAG: hypothetical protein KGV56_00470 [Gammaproteobacteria bacterium]|nr:hypothetical protein [Gammaproteobacteria bacterium]
MTNPTDLGIIFPYWHITPNRFIASFFILENLIKTTTLPYRWGFLLVGCQAQDVRANKLAFATGLYKQAPRHH